MQQIERRRVVAYFGFLQHTAHARAQATAAAHEELADAIAQQVEEASDLAAAARLVQQQVEEAEQLCAEQQIMLEWASKFETFKVDAAQRFQALV